jgi:hypothetical protein
MPEKKGNQCHADSLLSKRISNITDEVERRGDDRRRARVVEVR